MQHALLGLALVLIVAIAAALAAPAYVDWNAWRATFERRASELAGAPVRIRGEIAATVLPNPAFVLHDVEIGDPEQGTGLRAGEVRGRLSLGALLRGGLEAEDFRVAPATVRIALDGEGRIVPPAGAASAAAIGLVAFSRVAIERGSLTIEDRASGALHVVDEISANGEMLTRNGPGRLDASLRHEGRRWSVRANAGRFAENEARVRLTVERPDDGVQFDAEGNLSLAGDPAFAGRVSLARRTPEQPWRIAAQTQADARLVALESIELVLGKAQIATELAGKVTVVPQRGGRIEGALAAKRIDLDAALGRDLGPGLLAALALLRETTGLLAGIPLTGHVALSADGLLAGGGTLREVRAEIAQRNGRPVLARFAARLPGRGSIEAIHTGSDAGFAGDVAIAAEDGRALVQWALGGEAAAAVEPGVPLRLGGRAEIGQRFALEGLEFALGEGKLGGRFAFTPAAATGRVAIDADLVAEGIDLALVAPFADEFLPGDDPVDLRLVFAGRGLRAFGNTLARIDAAVERTGAGIAVHRLAVDDFGGLSVRAQGRIAGQTDQPEGTMRFEIDAARAEGLAAVAQLLSPEAGVIVRQAAAVGLPLQLRGTASGEGAAAGVFIEAQGRLGDMPVQAEIAIDTQSAALADALVNIDAHAVGRLVALFGIAPGAPSANRARLQLAASAAGPGAQRVELQVRGTGIEFSAEGEVRSAGGRLHPRLDVRLVTEDLRPLLSAARDAPRALPARIGGRIGRSDAGITVENLAGEVGGVRVRGTLAVSGTARPEISGKLSLDRTELADLLGLALGRAGGTAFWPATPLGAPPLAATGAVDLEVAVLGLGALSAANASMNWKLGADGVEIADFSAEVAGGTLSGGARIGRGGALAFDGRIAFDGVELARLLPAESRARGRGRLAVSLAGTGATPAALIANLAGQGSVRLEAVEVAFLDPEAVQRVFAEVERGGAPDELAVIARLAPALQRGALRVAKLEAPLIVAAGVARSGRARASQGTAEIAADASVDLRQLTMDGALEILAPASDGVDVRPAATIRWRGPLLAPQRSIEAAALANAISLRAMQREQKRLEQRAPDRTEAPPDRANDLPTAAIPRTAKGGVPLPPTRPNQP